MWPPCGRFVGCVSGDGPRFARQRFFVVAFTFANLHAIDSLWIQLCNRNSPCEQLLDLWIQVFEWLSQDVFEPREVSALACTKAGMVMVLGDATTKVVINSEQVAKNSAYFLAEGTTKYFAWTDWFRVVVNGSLYYSDAFGLFWSVKPRTALWKFLDISIVESGRIIFMFEYCFSLGMT